MRSPNLFSTKSDSEAEHRLRRVPVFGDIVRKADTDEQLRQKMVCLGKNFSLWCRRQLNNLVLFYKENCDILPR